MTAFQSVPVYASLCPMIAMVVFRRLLFVFALLGIVTGPVSVGMAASAMALSSDMQMVAMAGMDQPDDMSGCPEQQPVQKNECGTTCPLALICSSIILAHEDKAEGWRVDRIERELSHGVLHDSHLPSAIVEPPARPPKA